MNMDKVETVLVNQSLLGRLLDYGSIQKFHENVMLPSGFENALYAEEVAIRTADMIRTQKQLVGSSSYSQITLKRSRTLLSLMYF